MDKKMYKNKKVLYSIALLGILTIVLVLAIKANQSITTYEGTINYIEGEACIRFSPQEESLPTLWEMSEETFVEYARNHNGEKIKVDVSCFSCIDRKIYRIEEIHYR